MHEYGIDPSNRSKSYFYLALFATLIVSLVKWGVEVYINPIFNTDYYFLISSAPIFMGLLWLFDNFMWKWNWIRKLCSITTPILEGKWLASICSSYDNYENIYTANYRIKQTWRKISIIGEFKASKSYSKSANFFIDNSAERDILYSYINEPKSFAKDTMAIHNGQVRADVSEDWKTIEGEYFTGRGRVNQGTIKLEKLEGDFQLNEESLENSKEGLIVINGPRDRKGQDEIQPAQ